MGAWQTMSAENPSNSDATLPLTFDEARHAQLRESAKTTPQQRLDWLGEMLEFMQELRAGRAPAP